MRFAVEAWAPERGNPVGDDALDEGASEVDAGVEVPVDRWSPRPPPPATEPLRTLVFVDGVRRVEAHLWIAIGEGPARPAICASYAAGAVRCEAPEGAGAGVARLVDVRVERGVFGVGVGEPVVTRHAVYAPRGPFDPFEPAEGEDDDGGLGTEPELTLLLQHRMADLESRVSRAAGPADLVVVDGPLRRGGVPAAGGDGETPGAGDDGCGGGSDRPRPGAAPGAGTGATVADRPVGPAAPAGGEPDASLAVGYVKTHRCAYGPPEVRATVAALAAGERTPLLALVEGRPKLSWYLRLPGPGRHAWAGVVRLEVPAAMGVERAAAVADRLAAGLGRFASHEPKDPRAPQNLYPVGGLERELRRRLGDPALLLRALREAAAAGPGPAAAAG